MSYIREINDDTNGGKIQQKDSGKLLIYLPRKRDQNISKKKL